MIKLMLITNDPNLARYAVDCGVQRIFIDLEILGKQARQGHLDTVISGHAMSDVAKVRQAIPDGELLVRLNPLNQHSEQEVNAAIDAGADLLMLPMFETAQQVAQFARLINGRVGLVPLLETPAAAMALTKIVAVTGITEIFIGLNDLHLGLNKTFMFEPLADGHVDTMAAIIGAAGLPFGFGGIARIGEGLLSAELILGEHLRLGSVSVILSRTFHRRSGDINTLNAQMDFKSEIEKLRRQESCLQTRSAAQIEHDRQALMKSVTAIVNTLSNHGS